MYLVRRTRSGKAHYWNGIDTACRMYSTGGMNPKRYIPTEYLEDMPICTMCRQVDKSGRYVR